MHGNNIQSDLAHLTILEINIPTFCHFISALGGIAIKAIDNFHVSTRVCPLVHPRKHRCGNNRPFPNYTTLICETWLGKNVSVTLFTSLTIVF